MTERIAAWSLTLVFAAQLLNLWPLPGHVAEKRIEFWSTTKAYWEGTDPSKSENPDWTAKAKAESLSEINKVLADRDRVVYAARVEWGLWLLSALAAGGAAVAALRVSAHWRWLSLVSLVLFMWLQQPWLLFVSQGRLDPSHTIQRLVFVARDFPGAFAAILLLNVVVPILFLIVSAYALLRIMEWRRNAL